jgi:hypothetical protein
MERGANHPFDKVDPLCKEGEGFLIFVDIVRVNRHTGTILGKKYKR